MKNKNRIIFFGFFLLIIFTLHSVMVLAPRYPGSLHHHTGFSTETSYEERHSFFSVDIPKKAIESINSIMKFMGLYSSGEGQLINLMIFEIIFSIFIVALIAVIIYIVNKIYIRYQLRRFNEKRE